MNTRQRLAKGRSELEYQKVARRMRAAIQIADAMEKHGITKKQLADKMGRRPSEITKWLSGDHNFTLDTLTDLSFYLKEKITGENIVVEKTFLSVTYTPEIEQSFFKSNEVTRLYEKKKWTAPVSIAELINE